MKNIDIKTVYNVPEAVSGIGFISHFVGFCLFILLFICALPCLSIDKTWLQDLINLIQDSGLFVTLECLLYLYFARFIFW